MADFNGMFGGATSPQDIEAQLAAQQNLSGPSFSGAMGPMITHANPTAANVYTLGGLKPSTGPMNPGSPSQAPGASLGNPWAQPQASQGPMNMPLPQTAPMPPQRPPQSALNQYQAAASSPMGFSQTAPLPPVQPISTPAAPTQPQLPAWAPRDATMDVQGNVYSSGADGQVIRKLGNVNDANSGGIGGYLANLGSGQGQGTQGSPNASAPQPVKTNSGVTWIRPDSIVGKLMKLGGAFS